MTPLSYFVCAIVALVGAGIHFVQNMNASRALAKRGYFEWTEKIYISDEKWSIVGSLLWIGFILLTFAEVTAQYAEVFSWKKIIFGVLGYGGDSMASKFLGKASERALAVLDDKTNQIDKINNTLDKPTPAVMPTDKK
jgi:hypothetical protein